jgi:hypothetical protein
MPTLQQNRLVLRPRSTLWNGLVFYAPLDEQSSGAGAVPRYSRVNGVTLTDNNTVTQATGQVRDAALFTAANSEYLSAADAPWQLLSTAASWAFWMKPTTVGTLQVVTAKWTYQTDGGWAFRQTTDAKLTLYIATTANDAGATTGETAAFLSAGTWAHVAIVYDGSGATNAAKLKVWTNGTAQTLSFGGTMPTSLRASAGTFHIGQWGGSATNYLNGAVDEYMLWNRAITPDEVAEVYANGLAGGALP